MNTTDEGALSSPGKGFELPALPKMPHGIALLGHDAPCEIDILTMKVTLGRKTWSHTSGAVPLMVIRWASAFVWRMCEDYRVGMICLETGEEWTVLARACRDEAEATHESIIASWVSGRGVSCRVVSIEKITGRSRSARRTRPEGRRGGESHG